MEKLTGSKSKSSDKLSEKSREDSKEDEQQKFNSKKSSREKLSGKSKSDSKSNSKEETSSRLFKNVSKDNSKDEYSKKSSEKVSKKNSKGSLKSSDNSLEEKNSKNNSEDKSNRSSERRKQRMRKQQFMERDSTGSEGSITEKMLEDEEEKLLRKLEDEAKNRLNKEKSNDQSIKQQESQEQNLDQQIEQNSLLDLSPRRSVNEEELNSHSSEKDKLIKDDESRKGDRRRSSSLYPPDSESLNLLDKRGLRTRLSRGSVFLIDENLTMQIDGGKRRLSSFFSTSSNEETVITMEEGITEEEMVENIKTHRQIIANTKTQHWPMHRKLKVLRKAKHYLKKHEGDMMQSNQAKDILAIYRTYFEKALRRLRREIDNLVVTLTPWEMRIKKIESQFGSVVAGYFTFLRWIFWINTFVGIIYVIFVMVPEVILFERKNYNSSRGLRKIKEDVDKPFFSTVSDINEFEGFLKFSPIFYGYFDTDDEAPNNIDFYYPLPLIYFVLTLVSFLFSFFFILRKMAKNAKLQRIGTKEDEFTFCWKLFTGWDYMIGNSETACNKVASIIMGLKEIILEEKEKKKQVRNWKLILKRIFANILILVILASSAYAVVLVVERSQRIVATNFFQRNEVNFVFAGLQFVCPILFSWVSKLEDNHPRIALRWQLGRILVLNILNFVCLLLSTFEKVQSQTKQLKEIKENLTLLYKLEIEDNKTMDLSDFVTQSIISTVTLTAIVREKRHEGEGRLFPPISSDQKGSAEEQGISAAKPTQFYQTTFYEEQLEGRLIKPKFVDRTNFFENFSIYNNHTEKPIDVLFTPVTTLAPLNVSSQKPPDRTSTTKRYPPKYKTTTTTIRPRITTRKPVKIIEENITEIVTVYQVEDNLTTLTSLIDDSNMTDITTTKKRKRPIILTTQSPNCTQEPELEIDPFKLFEFAQRLEREGFQNYTSTLKGLCWETSFGQELVKLTMTDLYLMIGTTILGDYLRAVFVRYCNDWPCFFWNLEILWPGYSDFQIAENILSLTNSQGLIWLGMFFAPGLPIINTFKLCIMMYFKSWAVLTRYVCCQVFKASGNNNFYYFLLLLMLFLACFPVAYCLVWFEPSWHCGPYSNYRNIYHILTKKLEQKLPTTANKLVDYISSSAFIIPLIMFKVLIIYYMYTSLASLKDANSDLKNQLRKDKDSSEHGAAKSVADLAGGSNLGVENIRKVRIEEPILDENKLKLLSELKDVIDSNNNDKDQKR